MDIEKYFAGTPVYEPDSAMTYMSPAQVPEADCSLEFKWIYGPPEPETQNADHTHDEDEIIFFFGGGPHTSRDLGAEIEFYIAGQSVTFNTTSVLFIPAGVPHGPVAWNKFARPHIQMTITLSVPDEPPPETPIRDSEEYLVRTPIREVGRGVKNRQMPTMTYMSRHLVPGANYYLECGWIYGMPEPNPHVFEHVHNYNELVFHFGSDPDHPEDLGGEIDYRIEGQPLTISTTSGLFIPKGVKHGPLTWKKYTRPHVEMTLIMGAGTFREVWDAEAFGGRRK